MPQGDQPAQPASGAKDPRRRRSRLQARQKTLTALRESCGSRAYPGLVDHVQAAWAAALEAAPPPQHLVLDRSLVLRPEHPMPWCRDVAAHDRKPLIRRLASPRGITVQVLLLALLIEQTRPEPARGTATTVPVQPSNRTHQNQVAWPDLVTAHTKDTSDDPRTVYGRRHEEKRYRQVTSALSTLDQVGMVKIKEHGVRDRFEGFQVLAENVDNHRTPVPYQIPDSTRAFAIPTTFVTNGWVGLLTESEITFYLAVAYLQSLQVGEVKTPVSLPKRSREQWFDFGKDTFEAHRELFQFGLIHTTMDPRQEFDYRRNFEQDDRGDPHVFGVVPGGLDQPAARAIGDGLERLIEFLEFLT